MTSHPQITKERISFLAAALAAFVFVPLFAFRRIDGFDFWWWMSLNVAVVVGAAFILDKSYFGLILEDLKQGLGKKIGLGFLSAVFVYAVFFIGNEAAWWLFPFAGNDIQGIYSFKSHASVLRIVFSMILLIGPGEELFWRGYLQRIWEKRFGRVGGYLLAACFYALVHAASGNIMLVLAAGVCGLFWGFLFLRYRSFVLNCISHILWDLMIFVFWPLG
jgi:membrane protease YdiL (CAAX protease family)